MLVQVLKSVFVVLAAAGVVQRINDTPQWEDTISTTTPFAQQLFRRVAFSALAVTWSSLLPAATVAWLCGWYKHAATSSAAANRTGWSRLCTGAVTGTIVAASRTSLLQWADEYGPVWPRFQYLASVLPQNDFLVDAIHTTVSASTHLLLCNMVVAKITSGWRQRWLLAFGTCPAAVLV